jgi:hypothetical protein
MIAAVFGLAVHTLANVEKVMFLGPAPTIVPFLQDKVVHLEALSPEVPELRRQLHAKFPHSPDMEEPSEIWVLLRGLEEGRRYEVRICWAATVRFSISYFC